MYFHRTVIAIHRVCHNSTKEEIRVASDNREGGIKGAAT